MSAQHGSVATFTWNSNALTSYLQDDLSATDEADTPDTTVFGATAETHMVSPIQKGQDIELGGVWDSTVHAYFAGLRGTSATATLCPRGTTSGREKWSGTCDLVKYQVMPPVQGIIKFKATLRSNGAFAWGTNP
jgi:hypothetical protein